MDKDFLTIVASEPEIGPDEWLWVFDPQEDLVHLEHNENRHPADHITHKHLAEKVVHPDRVHGYAYKIPGGWRITDWDHRPVEDRHVRKLVHRALDTGT